jgi:hypothetical protein
LNHAKSNVAFVDFINVQTSDAICPKTLAAANAASSLLVGIAVLFYFLRVLLIILMLSFLTQITLAVRSSLCCLSA